MISAVVFSAVGSSYFLYKFWTDYKNRNNKLNESSESINNEEFLNLKAISDENLKNLQENQITIATLNANIENFQKTIEEKEFEIQKQKEEIKQENEKLSKISNELASIKSVNENLLEEKKEHQVLKEKYEATQEQKSQFNALNQKIENNSKLLEEKNNELKEAKENLKNKEVDLKNKIEKLTRLETEYLNLQNLNKELHDKYTVLKEKYKQYEMDKHELDLFKQDYDEYKNFYVTCQKKYEVNLEQIEELKNFYNANKEQAAFWNREETVDNVLKGKDYEQKLKMIVENSFSSDELKTVTIIEQPKGAKATEKGDLAIEFYEHEHKDPKNHKNLSIFIEAKWGEVEITEDGKEMTKQYDKNELKKHLIKLFNDAKKFKAHFAWLVTNKIVDNESFQKDKWQWFCAKKDYEDHGIDNWDCENDPKIIILSEEKLSPLVQALYRDNKFKKHRPNIHNINIVTLQQDVEYITKINEAYVKNWKEYFFATQNYVKNFVNVYENIKKAVDSKSLKKARENFEIKNEICEKTVTSMEMLEEKLSKNSGNSEKDVTNYLSFEEKNAKETEIFEEIDDENKENSDD